MQVELHYTNNSIQYLVYPDKTQVIPTVRDWFKQEVIDRIEIVLHNRRHVFTKFQDRIIWETPECVYHLSKEDDYFDRLSNAKKLAQEGM
jgi:hypothetical protein